MGGMETKATIKSGREDAAALRRVLGVVAGEAEDEAHASQG